MLEAYLLHFWQENIARSSCASDLRAPALRLPGTNRRKRQLQTGGVVAVEIPENPSSPRKWLSENMALLVRVLVSEGVSVCAVAAGLPGWSWRQDGNNWMRG